MRESRENREQNRVARPFTMSVAFREKGPWPTWSLVTARDLSASGTTFSCEQIFTQGDLLIFSIQFMDRLIECEGRVVRSTPRPGTLLVEVAARFEELAMSDRDYIARYCQRLRRES